MTEYFALCVAVICAFICVSKSSVMSAPSMITIWAASALITHKLFATGVFNPGLLPTDIKHGLFAPPASAALTFCALCGTCAFSIMGPRYRLRLSELKLTSSGNSYAVAAAVTAISAISLACIVIYLFSADWGILWSSGQYYAMKSPALLVHRSALSMVVLQSLSALGFVTAAAFAVALARGNGALTAISAPPAVFLFLFQLAANSRATAISAITFAVVWLSQRPRDRGVALAASITAAVSWISAIEGRSALSGFAAIPANVGKAVAAIFSERLPFYIANALEGGFIVFEGSLHNFTYSPIYKILSFSPLPSFLDGFQQFNAGVRTRISYSIPVAGLTEAEKFGLGYQVLLFSIIYIDLAVLSRLSRNSSQRYGALVCALHFLSAFAVISMGAYSIRGTMRFLLLSLAIGLFLLVRARMSTNALPTHPQSGGLRKLGRSRA